MDPFNYCRGKELDINILCQLNLYERNSVKEVPLHYLCKNSNITLDIFIYISNYNFKIYDDHGSTPLHSLCENHHISFGFLLENKLINDRDLVLLYDNCKIRPLHELCQNSNITYEIFNYFKNSDMTINTYNNISPLHYLCSNHSITIEMLKEDYDLTIVNDNGIMPLHYLCINPSITRDIVTYLKKYDLEIVSKDIITPLKHLFYNKNIPDEAFYLYDCNKYFHILSVAKREIALYTLTLNYNHKYTHRDYQNYIAGIYRRDKFHLAHSDIRNTAIIIMLLSHYYKVKLSFHIVVRIGVLSFKRKK